MTDVRALLAAERQSRRITHPHLSYTKSGMLVCDVCNLNVKSEALWEGHLKSANHRKNAQLASKSAQTPAQAQAQDGSGTGTGTGKGLKRKIEHVDVDEGQEERYEADTNPDARKKKPKSRLASAAAEARDERPQPESVPREDGSTGLSNEIEHKDTSAASATVDVPNGVGVGVDVAVPEKDPANGAALDPAVDEDEWAAFEREVAPLAAAGSAPAQAPDYSSATISAAPVTAAQLEEQAEQDRRRRLETEADDEKEDEERRLEDEFDVMEEMEERVRKLREKRDALRNAVHVGADTGQGNNPPAAKSPEQETVQDVAHESDKNKKDDGDEDEDDDDDPDDWYS